MTDLKCSRNLTVYDVINVTLYKNEGFSWKILERLMDYWVVPGKDDRPEFQHKARQHDTLKTFLQQHLAMDTTSRAYAESEAMQMAWISLFTYVAAPASPHWSKLWNGFHGLERISWYGTQRNDLFLYYITPMWLAQCAWTYYVICYKFITVCKYKCKYIWYIYIYIYL
jgi:hypothetical protein